MAVLTCASVGNSISEALKARNNNNFSSDLTITPTIEKVEKINVPEHNLYEGQEYIYCGKNLISKYITQDIIYILMKISMMYNVAKKGNNFIQTKCSFVILEKKL